jgi:hypothetical protein
MISGAAVEVCFSDAGPLESRASGASEAGFEAARNGVRNLSLSVH